MQSAGRARAVAERYRDAYRNARTVIELGGAVKVIGIIGGTINLVASFGYEGAMGWVGAGIGIAAGMIVYVQGVLVSVAGHILLSTLDTAVNTSEYLTPDERAAFISR